MAWYGFSCKKLFNEYGNYKGFRVCLNSDHVDVCINGAGIDVKRACHINNSNGYVCSYNPYAFYSLRKDITEYFVVSYIAPGHSMLSKAPPPKQQAWYRKSVEKYWCKAIHNEWVEMLHHMDKENLRLARALFAANFKDGLQAGGYILGSVDRLSNEHRRDILEFVPAAMLAGNRPECFITKERTVVTPDIMDDDWDEDENGINWDSIEESDEDWRGYFCHESCDYIPSSLTNTLLKVKPGTSFSTVQDLRRSVVDRVIDSKQELIVFTRASSLHNEPSFRISNKDDIVTSIKILNSNGFKLSVRKTNDIINATQSIQYANVKGTQNMMVLAQAAFSQKSVSAP